MAQNKAWKWIKFLLWSFLWGAAAAFFCFAFGIELTWTRFLALLLLSFLIEHSLIRIVVAGIKASEAEKAAEERARAEEELLKEKEQSRIMTKI
jgi:hypothetical protein